MSSREHTHYQECLERTLANETTPAILQREPAWLRSKPWQCHADMSLQTQQ